jgi:hypothetical protein
MTIILNIDSFRDYFYDTVEEAIEEIKRHEEEYGYKYWIEGIQVKIERKVIM